MTNLISRFDGERVSRCNVISPVVTRAVTRKAVLSKLSRGFGKNRRDGHREGGGGDGRGERERERDGSFIIDPFSRTFPFPCQPPRYPPSSTYGDEWPCKKHDKTGEATYKFLHRANYEIRKEGRIPFRHVSSSLLSRVQPTHEYTNTRTDVGARSFRCNGARVVSFHI